MSFRLDEVDLEKDFDELMECQWAAHEDPPQPFFRLFCPILDDDRETSIKESTTRFLEWHRHEPEAIWLKVTDSISGKIVGGAWYKIYNDNPFKHHEDECVDWYPNDSTRDYVSQAITILDRPRMEKARRPQVFLNILFTHPKYRRRGIGSTLLMWGLETAKRQNLEFWLNATPLGKPLYQKYGFEVVERNPLVPKTDHPDGKWKQIEGEMGEVVFWTMWLPKEGAFEEERKVE